MGRLAWSEIRDVRLESIRGARGSSTQRSGTTIEVGGFRYASGGAVEPDMETATYGRLGIVPMDPERERRERGHLAWRLVRGFLGFARRSGRRVDVTDPDAMAPFGAYDFDLGGSLDGAVAAVRLYREITLPPVALAQPAPA